MRIKILLKEGRQVEEGLEQHLLNKREVGGAKSVS